jgi:hypothetical protein
MPTKEDFRAELLAQLDRAMKQGRAHVEINAGELHRTLGDYPGTDHRLPTACAAMREARTSQDKIIFESPSGNGAALTIRYELPRRG